MNEELDADQVAFAERWSRLTPQVDAPARDRVMFALGQAAASAAMQRTRRRFSLAGLSMLAATLVVLGIARWHEAPPAQETTFDAVPVLARNWSRADQLATFERILIEDAPPSSVQSTPANASPAVIPSELSTYGRLLRAWQRQEAETL